MDQLDLCLLTNLLTSPLGTLITTWRASLRSMRKHTLLLKSHVQKNNMKPESHESRRNKNSCGARDEKSGIVPETRIAIKETHTHTNTHKKYSTVHLIG